MSWLSRYVVRWLRVLLALLPLGVWGLTCEDATSQIREEVRRAGLHSQQLDTHLAGLVQDVHTLVDSQEQPEHFGGPGVEYGCHVPSVLANGEVEPVVDWFGQTMVTFRCDPGFELVGSPALICTDGRWNHSLPRCAAKDCKAHHSGGHTQDGLYGIVPDGHTPRLVYCDMTKNGGGWTVIQRRVDDSINFFRTYAEYQQGFGDLKTNFWLGLDTIHSLTQPDTEIYVDMVANDTHKAYASYSSFSVGDVSSGYLLSISGYTGNAGNSFSGNNHKFSTYDNDQDTYTGNCAQSYKAGWWYTACHSSNLNGLYLNGSHPTIYASGINWYGFTGHHYSLRWEEMKLRRKD